MLNICSYYVAKIGPGFVALHIMIYKRDWFVVKEDWRESIKCHWYSDNSIVRLLLYAIPGKKSFNSLNYEQNILSGIIYRVWLNFQLINCLPHWDCIYSRCKWTLPIINSFHIESIFGLSFEKLLQTSIHIGSAGKSVYGWYSYVISHLHAYGVNRLRIVFIKLSK